MKSNSGGATWEGLGGPVGMQEVTTNGIDPTLDSCCQREVRTTGTVHTKLKTLW